MKGNSNAMSDQIDHRLFLGLSLGESHFQQITTLPSALASVFIQDKPSDYLQKIEWNGVSYLGKLVDFPFDLANLDSLEKNILSLIRKVLPDVTGDDKDTQLVLFPMILSSS